MKPFPLSCILLSLGGCFFPPFLTPASAGEKTADCLPIQTLLPPAPNTTDPKAPFFIDTRGIDFSSPMMPQRDPHNPTYPAATDLPDTQLPPINKMGNFVLGPTHQLTKEWNEAQNGPHGRVVSFTLSSQQSHGFSPGITRAEPASCPEGYADAPYSAPGDPSHLIIPHTKESNWTRSIDLYIPSSVPYDRPLPFLIFGDGGEDGIYPGRDLFAMVDVLIKQHRIPPMVIIGVGAGGGDAQGSERGREYDTMSGAYADWVEHEILPRVEEEGHIQLSRNPDDRATMGFSSSGAAAFAMAWFRPNLYHRVLAYSPTLTNQQWPHNAELPGGAWQLHSPWAGSPKTHTLHYESALMPNSPHKPLRIWYEVGDQDLFYPVHAMPDGMHDWVLAGENMARVLQNNHYNYQFVFSRNANHVDGPTIEQTLPEALEWLWK
ncbi:esterase family protein [Saccharibacter sp. 17.LH.SD]|uniref:alpha/beta hydrolase n=1 Tax=Saccharibacter sp. 17.LH.SD TaxID=2689393 RepID=UPI0013680149|nr:alpha/beta hydrolase-fold protein [Saccharibacter sp. 17.LH.SD]MXV45257.1 esterase family protein [Saccharibacter sp. 17.LH.SD]